MEYLRKENDMEKELIQFFLNIEKLKEKFAIEIYDNHSIIIHSSTKIDSPHDDTTKFKKNIDLAFSALVHGDEPIGLSIINNILERIIEGRLKFKISIAFILFNVEAFKKKCRFIEYDLNRVFFNKEKSSTLEGQIASSKHELLKRCHYLIDLHQTSTRSTSPFIIFEYKSLLQIKLAFLTAPQLPIVAFCEPFSLDGYGVDEFICRNSGVPLTFELGKKGFDHYQLGLGLQMCLDSIWVLENCNLNEEISNIEKANLYDFSFTHTFEQNDSPCLIEGLQNLSEVKKGQKLGRDRRGPIKSPESGLILFPKYGELIKSSSELFRIITKTTYSDYLGK